VDWKDLWEESDFWQSNLLIRGSSKNVIPAKAGIYKFLTTLGSRLRGSDKFGFIGGCLMLTGHSDLPVPFE